MIWHFYSVHTLTFHYKRKRWHIFLHTRIRRCWAGAESAITKNLSVIAVYIRFRFNLHKKWKHILLLPPLFDSRRWWRCVGMRGRVRQYLNVMYCTVWLARIIPLTYSNMKHAIIRTALGSNVVEITTRVALIFSETLFLQLVLWMCWFHNNMIEMHIWRYEYLIDCSIWWVIKFYWHSKWMFDDKKFDGRQSKCSFHWILYREYSFRMRVHSLEQSHRSCVIFRHAHS